jgi:hypothetical protein
MPEDPKPPAEPIAEAIAPETPDSAPENEEEAGEFITRNVLEKDTVFFEG